MRTRVVVLRVTDHKQPEQRPLDAVRGDIEASLRANSAHDAARGAADAAAKREEAGDSSGGARRLRGVQRQRATLQRTDATLPAELVGAVFAAPRPARWPAESQAPRALTSGDAAVFVVDDGAPGSLPDVGGCDRNGPAGCSSGRGCPARPSWRPISADLERTAKITRNEKAFE